MQKVLEPDTRRALYGSQGSLAREVKTEFKIVKEFPENLSPRKIEEAVLDFIQESHVKGDPIGIFNQTMESIAGSTVLGGSGYFWLGTEGEKVVSYLLAHVTKDIDNLPTYYIPQAWVAREYRGNQVVKMWWEKVREHAKSRFCKHIVLVSSRNEKAYERFLGHGLTHYASLLMEDI